MAAALLLNILRKLQFMGVFRDNGAEFGLNGVPELINKGGQYNS